VCAVGASTQKGPVSPFSIVIFARDAQLEFDEGPFGPFLVGSGRRGFTGLKAPLGAPFYG